MQIHPRWMCRQTQIHGRYDRDGLQLTTAKDIAYGCNCVKIQIIVPVVRAESPLPATVDDGVNMMFTGSHAAKKRSSSSTSHKQRQFLSQDRQHPGAIASERSVDRTRLSCQEVFLL